MTMHDELEETYDIGELATLAEVTRRTVRYYVAEGLLPSPGGAGQQRTYTRGHLLRLRAIKKLKDAYLPLDEIGRRLDGLDEHALEEILAVEPDPAPESASDYIAAVLGATPQAARRTFGQRPADLADSTLPATPSSPIASPGPTTDTSSTPPLAPPPSFARRTARPLASPIDQVASEPPGSAGSPSVILPAISSFIKERRATREKGSRGEERSDAADPAPVARQSLAEPSTTAADMPATTAWQRVALGPGVELHYQETRDERRNAVLGRIIQFAQDLLARLA